MLTRWQSTIVDAQGNIQPFAILTILNEETQAPAQIYASESESQPLPAGTVVADESGYAYFYARGGRYRIQADGLNIDWRHVPLGNLAAMDLASLDLDPAATIDVVQTTGSSTTAVMSQKAVTDGLDLKADASSLGSAATRDVVSSDTDTSGGNKLVTQRWAEVLIDNYALGVEQEWQDRTANRWLDTAYTNTTGRPIVVSVAVYAVHDWSSLDFRVDDVLVDYFVTGYDLGATVSAVVPHGSSYGAYMYEEDTLDIIAWSELR